MASTTAHLNTHLAMLLKRRGIAGRDAILRGILGSGGLARFCSGRRLSSVQRGRRSRDHRIADGWPRSRRLRPPSAQWNIVVPIGRALERKHIPFIYCTAYADAIDIFPGASRTPRVDKPVRPSHMRDALLAVLKDQEFPPPIRVISPCLRDQAVLLSAPGGRSYGTHFAFFGCHRPSDYCHSRIAGS